MQVVQTLADTELVSNLRSGQKMEDAVKALYKNYFESLSWYILQNSGTRQDAEDIFQEVIVTFIDLVQKDKYRGEASIKTFLFSLNRHIWLNELKKRGRAALREEKFEKGRETIDEDAGKMMAGRESSIQLRDLLDRLGENCKKILLLFYYENLSIKDILENLHYENEQVVRNKKYKCMKQLEQMVEKDPPLRQTLKNILHG